MEVYIVHFMKYEDGSLVDAWVTEDTFPTYNSAKEWITAPSEYVNYKEVREFGFIAECFLHEEDDLKIKAFIHCIYVNEQLEKENEG